MNTAEKWGMVRPERGYLYCSANGCKNNKRQNPDLHFHTFPKDIERWEIWATRSGREDLLKCKPELVHRNYRMCSSHFKDYQFKNYNKTYLRHDAVPLINLMGGDIVENIVENDKEVPTNEYYIDVFLTVPKENTEHQFVPSDRTNYTDISLNAVSNQNNFTHAENTMGSASLDKSQLVPKVSEDITQKVNHKSLLSNMPGKTSNLRSPRARKINRLKQRYLHLQKHKAYIKSSVRTGNINITHVSAYLKQKLPTSCFNSVMRQIHAAEKNSKGRR